ncbi:hypothetical protein H0H92_005022 [Tricholoma furcatifolium]|nr:hypothetical protein H0H92_005022 [Tricholoma furcatifolium]
MLDLPQIPAKLNEQADDPPFIDPYVEGAFITSESRDEAHQYIQEHIKGHESIINYYKRRHESIIRYYKRRQNALTVTCRIPVEVLGYIFSHAARDIVGDYANINALQQYRTDIFMHICSHWREVALSTPTLWSIIDLDNAGWAEMLRLSKTVPLSVIHAGPEVSEKAYPGLMHILNSHLPRIKHLLLDRYEVGFYRNSDAAYKADEYWQAILPLLGQDDSLKMERLTMKASGPMPFLSQDAVPLLDRIITQQASLKHLTLGYFGISWEALPAFGGLKSFTIYDIPKNLQPSTGQLLHFISRAPRLETLFVDAIDSRQEILPSNTKYICMEYLQQLRVHCNSISVLRSFFDNLTLSKNRTISVIIHSQMSNEPSDTTALQALTQRLDDLTNGPILRLTLEFYEIKCWKHELVPLWDRKPPAIQLKLDDLKSGFIPVVLRSLRLDQLVYLVVGDDAYCGEDVWFLLGDLPHLEELEIRRIPIMFEALCRQVHIPQSKTNTQATTHLAFPALTTLEFFEWGFNECKVSGIGALYQCIKRRRSAKLPLKKLRFNRCEGVQDYLVRLKQVVDEVLWKKFTQRRSANGDWQLEDNVSVITDSSDEAAEREDQNVVEVQDHVESAITHSSD